MIAHVSMSVQISEHKQRCCSPPKTKWNAVRSLTRFMTGPRLGVTTLRPIETTSRRKKEIEFLPALRIATGLG